ncbi:peroxiredoxin [Bradyrhizobium sp. S69]|uniref:peroxiredoxin family protein n=1 Tax=Bradyrhizobium sp. S69 TaxID=1641856 RepID=UPI00131D19B3|nr:peroxiredoxin [Bradyrhizobium sp. S69]
MSKKTRKKTLKKSSKTAVGKAARARSATSTKKPAAKKRATPAKKSAVKSPPKSTLKSIPASSKPAAKAAAKTTASKPAASKPAASKTTASKTTAPKVSHPVPSKPLKPPAPAEVSPPATPESKPTVATKPAVAPVAGHAALAEGSKAPAFRLPRDGGETVSLADFAGRKLVLFFYPRANTPGCTKEAIDFTRLAGAFAESQTAVLGVSADPLKAQESFRDKHELGIPLVSDEQHGMLEAYGVWGEKSMYGKTFLGVLRTTVLIGADGRIIRIWRHVKVDGHADEVLAAAKGT